MTNDALGDRMKRYEGVSRNYLTRRTPVIIRLDGKAFHTFTRGFKKPYDDILMGSMQRTMQYLCQNIQGCVLGYTQSDEITLVLTDYEKLTTDAWFGYNIQKCASVAASMATMYFNKIFEEGCESFLNAVMHFQDEDIEGDYLEALEKAIDKGAMFDARVFNIPKEEVCNCLIWRQQDATRNSIQSAGRYYFSHKQLHNKNCNQIQEMLFQEHGVNWNDYPDNFKRGTACFKQESTTTIVDSEGNEIEAIKSEWVIDEHTPVFTQNRDYVERWL